MPVNAQDSPAPQADEEIQIAVGRLYLSGDGVLYRQTADGEWQSLRAGLPRHRVYPFSEDRPVRLTSASATPSFHDQMIATSGTDLYQAEGSGPWRRLAERREFGTYAYLTASAVSPTNPDEMVVGTSFHGLFRTGDGGAEWTDISGAFGNLSRGARYMDDFSGLAYGADGASLYVAARLGTELYRLDLPTQERSSLPLPPEGGRILQLSLGRDGRIEALTEEGIFRLGADDRSWRSVADLAALPAPVLPEATPEDRRRMERASGRYAMYVPFLQAEGAQLEEHISFAQEHGINAFVIDFKDDRGRLTYNSELETARRAGAVRGLLDIDTLSGRLEEAGIYLIARVVVFKDEQLYRYDDQRLAIRDARSGEPWGHRQERRDEESGETVILQREHWVDPFSPEVWEYNVGIAEELAAHGVDEIQFDYIRFPSDGPVQHMRFPQRREGMRRIDALESFLKMARERVEVPLGTDVFGFNGWYEMDYLAQNIAMIARHIDVIGPMYYPSHFDSRFLGDEDFFTRAREIYRVGSRRARQIVNDRALIRPYVQAFLIGAELRFEEPEYSRYLTEQIEGSLAAGTEGFMLWNFSGRYYMVVRSLREYTSLADGPREEGSPHLD